MLSSFIYFALLQVVSGLAIEQSRSASNNIAARSARLQAREIDTSVKVALGLCIPGAALVIGLAIVIVYFYPAQLRKLRKQHPDRDVGLADLMNGKVVQHPAPPPYSAHHDSPPHDPSSGTNDAPVYTPPKSGFHAEAADPAEARHAALRLG
jgi:hypothetical protein